MVGSIRELLNLRWRTAQVMSAMVRGDGKHARAVRAAMRVEGIDDTDMVDEFRLLRNQFGHRPIAALSDEVARLWHRISQMCVRCDRVSRYRDNDGVCWRCIIEEP